MPRDVAIPLEWHGIRDYCGKISVDILRHDGPQLVFYASSAILESTHLGEANWLPRGRAWLLLRTNVDVVATN